MILEVRLFARAKDLGGADVVAVEIADGATVADLRAVLRQSHPKLAGLLERSAVGVNGDFAEPTQPLAVTDEIAVLPPVSGGV